MEQEIELGMKAKDVMTGFKGTVYGISNYLTGCRVILLVGKVDKDGKWPSAWFDEDRVVQVKGKILKIGVAAESPDTKPVGGPQHASEFAPTK